MTTIKRGSKGEAVKELQTLLDGLEVDGIFGKLTEAAVKEYQKANGLKVDGIVGCDTWSRLLNLPTPLFVQPKDFKQGDKRWGSKLYTSCGNKKQTMASSGCFPTTAADIVATLYDKDVLPPDMADLALQWGCRTKDSGTSWSFPRKLAKYYNVKMIEATGINAVKECLNVGGYVFCSMGAGYWTNGGHGICAWKYDGEYIYCNDPASTTRKKQKITQFLKERKRFFCFYPKT